MEKKNNFATPLREAKFCPEGPVKDLFQNVNFREKCKFCNIGVFKTCLEGPAKYLLQIVNFGEKCKFCNNGVAKTCPEHPVKDLFQNVNFGDKCQFCNKCWRSQNLSRGPCKGLLSKCQFETNVNFATLE